MNLIFFSLHILTIGALTLLILRLGALAISAWLGMLSLAMNLFALKQIELFGLSVTASDALAVGYLLALSLVQEFFGSKMARSCIWISFLISASFVLLSWVHLLYLPTVSDVSHPHFMALLFPMPRIVLASFTTFLIVQLFDTSVFSYLKKKWQGKYLASRTVLTLTLSQGLDTLLFSFLGLYGYVESIGHIILFSFIIKMIVILVSTPFISLSKKVVRVSI